MAVCSHCGWAIAVIAQSARTLLCEWVTRVSVMRASTPQVICSTSPTAVPSVEPTLGHLRWKVQAWRRRCCWKSTTRGLPNHLHVCSWDTSVLSTPWRLLKQLKQRVGSIYSIHLLIFLMEARCVLCELRTEYLYVVLSNLVFRVGAAPGPSVPTTTVALPLGPYPSFLPTTPSSGRGDTDQFKWILPRFGNEPHEILVCWH